MTKFTKYKIGHLFDVQLGKMLNEKAKVGTQSKYLANFNVRWGKFDLSTLNSMHFSDKEKDKYKLLTGDLLMCEGGEIGRCAVWNDDKNDIYFQKALHRIRAKTEYCTTDYLSLYFQLVTQTGRLIKYVGESSIAHLTREKLIDLAIPCPPLPEQKAIADLLSTWDDAIEKTERLISAKEKAHLIVSKELLFGHKRIDGHAKELTGGHFFKYASDWSYMHIKEIAKEVTVRNTNKDAIVLSCSKYDGFVNSLDYFGKKVFSDDTSNYKAIKKWQFGYPANHVEEGSIGLLEHCDIGIVSPIYIVFETDSKKVHPQYLYKLLKTNEYKHIFQVNTSSSVDRRGSLRWSDFSDIKIVLPPLKEQQKIVNTLENEKRELQLLRAIADKYKQQKRGLMQKHLTGTWRVKVSAP